MIYCEYGKKPVEAQTVYDVVLTFFKSLEKVIITQPSFPSRRW